MDAFDRLIAGVAQDVAARESRLSYREIKAMSKDVTPPRDAYAALSQPGCAVIAELKRANPNEPLAKIESPALLARALEGAGARIIACNTEARAFHGNLHDVATVRTAISAPVLCRDFIVDPYQIHEARYYGADAMPLVVEILDQPRLEALTDRIESLGMLAILQVRTVADASRAIAAGARVVGVEARDLRTGTIDPNIFAEIAPGLPSETIRVAMSGVKSGRDLMTYAGAGADAVMVGESLVTAEDPSAACRRLVTMGLHPACPSVH